MTVLIGRSPLIRDLVATMERVATSDVSVLIHGEVGTGKRRVAEALHARSSRSDRPFVAWGLRDASLDQIESDLFELAQGGTLFLEDIGALDPSVQPRLLRAIEQTAHDTPGEATDRRSDVRIVTATHRDLRKYVEAGRFRCDLFLRLSVVTLSVPPLRERREDIPLLVEHFLDAARTPEGRRTEITACALAALSERDWPGNVRELKDVVERARSLALPCQPIDRCLLDLAHAEVEGASTPIELRSARGFIPFKHAKDLLVTEWEREYLVDLLNQTGGNVSHAARRAGLARGHLHRLLAKHGLTR